jgi:Ca2+-binding RTX toxin-like protein
VTTPSRRPDAGANHVIPFYRRKGSASVVNDEGLDKRSGDNLALLPDGFSVFTRGGAPAAALVGTAGDDVIQGTSGNDLIQGLAGDDWLYGNDGDDRIEGGDDDDALDAGAGNDLLYGGTGNDNLGDLSDMPGNEQFYGEDGHDTLFIEWVSETAARTVLLDGGAGNDFIDFYAPNHMLDQVTLIGGTGNDVISGYGGLDVIIDAGAGADRVIVVMEATNFTVTLGADADRLRIATLDSGAVAVTDFAAGDTGDQLELLTLLDGTLIDWDEATNPFATGHMRLLQNGADTLVQIDRDAGGATHGFVNLVTLRNVTAGALTAFNLGFFPPDGSVPAGQTIIGTEFNNVLTGNFGDDVIQGLAGDDRIRGRAGNDQIDGGDDDDTLDGDEGNDVIHGGDGFDVLMGGLGDDLLYGGADSDTIEDRASGNDQLFGGAGFDFMSVDRSDTGPFYTILMDAGADGARIRFIAGRYGDIVTIQGSDARDDIGVYGGGIVTIEAGADDDEISINHLGGSVSLTLGAGTDSLHLQNIVNGGLVTVNDFAGGPAGDRIYVQGIFNPYQLIQRGADTVLQVDLNGSAAGGYVDYVLIKNTLAADFVLSSDQYLWTPGDQDDDPPIAVDDTIPAFEGALYSGGSLLINDSDPDGPGLSIAMVNGSAANVGQFITLASGAQLRVGADGDWSYNALGATFVPIPDFFSGASNLYLYDSFTYTLTGGGTATVTVQVQGADSDDVLHGTAGNDLLFAGIGNDVLVAGAGNDELNGGIGNDILYGEGGADIARGGTGDDVYIIESMADVTEEAAGEGNDTIIASISYVLSSNQEIETLSTQTHAGTDDVFLTGNQYNNTLIGNAGDNIMNGVDGADVMIGLAGDDIYAIDNLGDLVIDGFGQGNDLVLTYLSHTLSNGNQIETLSTVFHQGTTAINLGGNDYDNTLIGNYGANYLNGNGGVDVMIGLNGNDTYVVENALDVVEEVAGGGSDVLFSFVSYVLAAGQEVETVSTAVQSGTAALALTGNEYAQTIIGNAGANLLDGKGGNDTLYGLGGADTFAFTTTLGAGNVDTVADFVAGTDRIGLDDAIFTAIGATLNASAFVIGTAAGDADDRIVYNSATGALLYDADGSGAGAAIQFATLTPGLTLTASDFALI